MEKTIKIKQDNLIIFTIILRVVLVVYVLIHLLEKADSASPFYWTLFIPLLFIGASVIYDFVKMIRQRKDKDKIGLALNDKGITDFHSELKNVGLIPWSEITMAGIENKMFSTLLILKVKNPSSFIDKMEGNFKEKRKLRQNNARYQTPVVINITDLDIKAQQLRDLIKNEIKRNI